MRDRSEHIRFRYAVFMAVAFVAVLWIVKAIEFAADESFAHLGIFPRTFKGAIGILTGPLIHGDIFHHIGASGVVYGMASFLFFSGILRKNKQLMTVSGVIIFLYGGMLYGIFPDAVEHNVSWESHLTGALFGVILAFLFRKTKVDFDQGDSDEEDIPKEGKGTSNFHHSGGDQGVEIYYTYKPTEKGS